MATMESRFLGFIVLFITVESGLANHCDRTPDRPLRPKNTEDADKYVIEISGHPTSYIAGENYTVMLKYNPLREGMHMFRDFLLSVEREGVENQLAMDTAHSRVGFLKLSGDMLSTFSRKCENAILQTSSVPKNAIEVYWIAPLTGSGCVAFRATVVETIENWFSDDGSLTKILCEEISENEDIQPAILEECCACDEAKYELIFEGLWTRNTHPKDYPSNIWNTKFGDIVGASHVKDESFWKYEGSASENLKILAEKGDTSNVETELKEKMGKSIRTIIRANGLRYPNITGKSFTFFRVDGKSHLVSIVSKITPSPDWIVGVSSFELCLKDCSWAEKRILNLYPWDIGTDDGASYNSINEPSIGQQTIQKIGTEKPESPFYDPEGNDMKPFARVYFTRLKTYKKECDVTSDTLTTPMAEMITEEGQSEDCLTTAWTEWSACSEKCGEGFMFRKKELLIPDNEDLCSVKLVEHKSCVSKKCSHHEADLLAADDPRCELTDWKDWSSCSSSCGKGTITREKKFKNPEFAAQCENNDPSILQENGECTGVDTDHCPDDSNKETNCWKTVWGPWSPCNVTCGTGIKTRLRMPDSEKGGDEITESECRNMEQVQCYEPLCQEEESSGAPFGGMSSFNQVTTDNIFSQPYGPVANCKVSNWSVWGPCESNNGECGKGYRTQHRQILQHAMNGGKSCPRKLFKKRGCHIACRQEEKPSTTSATEVDNNLASGQSEITTETNNAEESVDCVMSPWSQWSPCSLSCGGSAVQQRTRSIQIPARKNGRPCGKRLDQRACPLPLACSDKGVPIM